MGVSNLGSTFDNSTTLFMTRENKETLYEILIDNLIILTTSNIVNPYR
mgnify:CR=1 FL=1